MTLEVLAALVVFALVASITPGPNNLMLLASGVNFGFRRTLPHMLGIAVGFTLLLFAVGMGLGALIERFPRLYLALKIVGGLYLLYLAWRIVSARSLGSTAGAGRPLSFFEAAAFQWVNPKAWVMGVAALAAYTDPQNYMATMLLVCLVFVLVGVPSISVWTAFGTAMRQWLSDPYRLKLFNISMGLLLVVSLWPMLQ